MYFQLVIHHPPTCGAVSPKCLWQACKSIAKPGVPLPLFAPQQTSLLRHLWRVLDGDLLATAAPFSPSPPATCCSELVAAASGCCGEPRAGRCLCVARGQVNSGFQEPRSGPQPECQLHIYSPGRSAVCVNALPSRLDRSVCRPQALSCIAVLWTSGG